MDPRDARTCQLPPRTVEADGLQVALREWADAIARRDVLVERVAHAKAQLEAVHREHEVAKLSVLKARAQAERLLGSTGSE
ncbi:MAG: hypothetical protein KBD62_36805 [Kofleriaceae bacterium]|nr:hypothetical protein [Kofleriaceae bacterium]